MMSNNINLPDVDPEAQQLADVLARSLNPEKLVAPIKDAKSLAKEEFEQLLQMKELRASLAMGFDTLIHELPHLLPQVKWELIEDELKKSLLSSRKESGLSDGTLGACYAVAFQKFTEREYDLAAGVFLILSLLSPGTEEFWCGLGLATECGQRFDLALIAFATAALINASNPLPRLHAAQINLILGRRKEAKVEFDKAAKILEFVEDKVPWQYQAEWIRLALE